MPAFRPLSVRDKPDPRFDEPQEGLPDYLLNLVRDWVIDQMRGYRGEVDDERLASLQLSLRPPTPFYDSTYPTASLRELLRLMEEDRVFALDVVDRLLLGSSEYNAAKLDVTLSAGGSAWEVSQAAAGDGHCLTRRSLGPVREAIDSTEGDAPSAHRHLMDAWINLAGRNPDASEAYHDATRAVEAAACPVVIPRNQKPTFGQVNSAIRDDLSRWTFVLGDSEVVLKMMQQLWDGQHDRHGTHDGETPAEISMEEADAAVHLAITLVRFFAAGLFRRR